MSRFDTLISSGVVAVIRKQPREHIVSISKALVNGGVSGLEVTMDSDDALGAIAELRTQFGEEVVIGAGTVIDAEQAVAAIQAGAEFIFAPILNEPTIRAAKRHGKIMIPGIFTPTEAQQAVEWGADMVKAFPADVLGAAFIKAVKGPLSHIQIMPTGGVNLDTIDEFIKAGATAVGAGGPLLRKDLIEAQDWQGLEQHAAAFVGQAKKSLGK
ncbi:bifunctional 4-hydroxy-2-oxoglutarate aldolase/2-dehydro-3-deoxy-phosphogluconate aldolase [Alkalicoccobacillus plakortidis]|uniref:Bifunctional 4-hydroxy-2-oxoglutarate aldolase/2-dehydro-3-deoxy-phosphogluconate aldolase n=1 Tax=Alkalicoccobacillus plakortidis TaxID=444060 RepID=A0ABT0XE02_9BACI|nr:bifunctional 4-hydroxy-2-oxoglutarate aldolase/2-dehydro-3-deoxy-phosphogluconate aldolase [Alkalicoccobacillus plakortidis]MCM2674131.1 bifunctional 4-hydroxy-2-oxoglutarate aldolase/2-dehydro-3-deoxy-phosphogluconate aldolase [Alkalicoccobacillus plakortidis]